MSRKTLTNLLKKLLCASPSLVASENALIDELVNQTLEEKVDLTLFGSDVSLLRDVIAERMALFRRVATNYDRLVQSLSIQSLGYPELWKIYLPLAQHLVRCRQDLHACFVVAIAGGPGCGKTVLASVLELILTLGYKYPTVTFSSDDFYLSRADRLALGHQWRGLPGTYDIKLVSEVFTSIRESRNIPRLPRYDLTSDNRSHFETVTGPLRFCIFEGWMAAKLIDDEFGSIDDIIDYLIYIDTTLKFLKEARCSKEANLRQRSKGMKGFSEQEMSSFWKEIIKPGIINFVLPYRSHADLIINIGESHSVLTIRFP